MGACRRVAVFKREARLPGGVLRIAKRRIFPRHPPLTGLTGGLLAVVVIDLLGMIHDQEW